MDEFEDCEYKGLKGPLKQGRYQNCIFENCQFTQNGFSGSSFQDCRFKGSLLNLVDLTSVRLKDVKFSESKLMGLSFSLCDTLLFSPVFTHCKLFRCIFTQIKPKVGLKFDDCNIEECDFSEAKIKGSSFTRCRLPLTRFHHTDLSQSDFTESVDFTIDVTTNKINQCKFSASEVHSLLNVFDLEIV